MRTKIFYLGLMFLFLLSAASGITDTAGPPQDFNLEDYDYVEDQLLVKFKPTVSSLRANQVLKELGIERINQIKQLRVDLLQLPKGLTVEKALEIFNKRQDVEYAEPNVLLSIASNLQAEDTGQWALQKIRASEAWSLIPLENQTPVVIGIVDTGLDPNTPDLNGNIWNNPGEIPGDLIDNDNNGKIDDSWGWDIVNNDNDPMDDVFHGTAVATVAAGKLDNQGIAGVCPWCQVMAVKVIGSDGTGSLYNVSDGIIYAANEGARIINLSLAGQHDLLNTLKGAIDYAWGQGVLLVSAAGNDGANTPMSPADYPNVMSVGSTDDSDGHSCFSNYADGYVTVSAPGSAVDFIDIRAGYDIVYGNGTSLSTPHVSGLAGLLLSQNPNRTNQDLWDIIASTTVDLGPPGTDAFFGTGRIDAYRALTGDTTPTISPHQDYVTSGDATAYAHARKLARSADGTLHRVWYEKDGGLYKILYSSSSDDGTTWSPRQEVFSSSAESYHPAIAVDKDNIYVVFPTLYGTTKYQIAFSKKPISGGAWTFPVRLMGGSYNAVRPDIYLDPTNNRLHVVGSSFDDAQYVYYRYSDNGGANWSATKNIDYVYKTRYASVYAYGEKVYIVSRTTDANFLIPTFYLFIMRSLDGGATWQDRGLFAQHTAISSSEYGISLTGFEDTLYFMYEHNQDIYFGKSTDGVNWLLARIYAGGGKWPTVTAMPTDHARMAWVGSDGNVKYRKFIGVSGTYLLFEPTETLPAASYPNFKRTSNYGQTEWVSTICNGSPFGISYATRAEGINFPPLAFFTPPATATAGSPASFTANASYDPDGDTLTFDWDFGDGGIGSGVAPAHIYQAGGTYLVTLTIHDGNGGTDSASTTITVEAQQTTTFTLTYTAGPGGSLSGTTTQVVNSGSDGTAVTAVPDPGYHFVDWSDGLTDNPRTDTNVTDDLSVTANFAPDTFTLTYSAGIGGSISGETSQEVNYGTDGTAVTAIPNPGYHFVDWSDGSTDNPRTDTNVTANVDVTANFAIDTFTLTYSAGIGGTISGTSPQTVNYGASGTAVEAVPDTGNHFVDWSDGLTDNPRTDTNVTADLDVTANFEADSLTLTYVAVADIPVAGTVSGSYTDTQTDNAIYEAIRERESGGKPSSRYSYLEHKWSFYIPAGNTTTVYLNAWNEPSSDGDSFVFAYSTDDNFYTTMFTLDNDDSSTILMYQLPDTTQGPVYIRVQDSDQGANHRSLDTVYIDYLSIEVNNQPGSPPLAPSGLNASSDSFSQIDLSWQDNAAAEDGFSIYRSTDSTNWTQISTVNSNVTTYQDSNVSPETTYFYQVQAFNASGSSEFSNTASATTPSAPVGSNIHVEELIGSSQIVRSKWEANVTVIVYNQVGALMEGVFVSGAWIEGGEATCVTGPDGACSVTKNNLKLTVLEIRFTVTNLDLTGYTYDPGANKKDTILIEAPQ